MSRVKRSSKSMFKQNSLVSFKIPCQHLGNSPTLYQQSNGNAIAQPGQQQECPAMCARWDTVLKENGQMENTPVVMSPMVPGDTLTQCPKQCEPKCCNAGSQSLTQSADQPQALEGNLQDDQGHPPACMAGCPKACYPACRPGCCNAPRMSTYQQSMAPQTPMMQPMPQPYVQQPIMGQSRETIPNPALLSYPSQGIDAPAQRRDIIPYTVAQVTPARFASVQYGYAQPEITSQTRATIPQPDTSFVQARQPVQQRSNVPKSTAFVHAATCPIPCSPMCAPHCTKHCCESYD